jgi:phosphoenolpyruvate-protein kinase (PTS system EI component)
MPKNLESKNIDQLLAEADELIRQINSDAIKDMEEEHRIQFEKHAQNLKKIKSEVQVINSLLTNQHLSQYSVEEIRNTLGESVRFQQKRERHYIDERKKDDLLNGLMDSFIKRTLNYLSLPDFPGKSVLKESQAYRKRKTWYQNV